MRDWRGGGWRHLWSAGSELDWAGAGGFQPSEYFPTLLDLKFQWDTPGHLQTGSIYRRPACWPQQHRQRRRWQQPGAARRTLSWLAQIHPGPVQASFHFWDYSQPRPADEWWWPLSWGGGRKDFRNISKSFSQFAEKKSFFLFIKLTRLARNPSTNHQKPEIRSNVFADASSLMP